MITKDTKRFDEVIERNGSVDKAMSRIYLSVAALMVVIALYTGYSNTENRARSSINPTPVPTLTATPQIGK